MILSVLFLACSVLTPTIMPAHGAEKGYMLACEDFRFIVEGVMDSEGLTSRQRSEIIAELVQQVDPACLTRPILDAGRTR